jgi:hypothetical protein
MQCNAEDTIDGRDRWWHQIAQESDQKGHAAERWIRPLGDSSPENLPICGTEDSGE